MSEIKEVIAKARCYEHDCGGVMEGRKGEYRYTECGLNSVWLKDVLVFHCTKCNAIVPEIHAAGVLHWVIALRVLRKKTLLTGSELRFLRKMCGYSVIEFGEIMGSDRTVVSRWETHNTHGEGTDRTVRLLTILKLAREATGKPGQMLKNVTIDQLTRDIEAAFKVIEGRRVTERYDISPEEIALYTGTSEPEVEVSAVH